MKPGKLIKYIFFISILTSQICTAEDKSGYISDTDLKLMPQKQREFVKDIVTAFRSSNPALGKSRLHSSAFEKEGCADRFLQIFKRSTIKEQYAVKVTPDRAPGSLRFSIRHQKRGEDNKRDFMSLRNVVAEKGKLVMKIKCR